MFLSLSRPVLHRPVRRPRREPDVLKPYSTLLVGVAIGYFVVPYVIKFVRK